METVLVLGTHRSGTSLVTGMLHKMGVNMGPPGRDVRWIYPNWANPTGQFENPEFTELLHRFLDSDGQDTRWNPRWADLTARTTEFLPAFVRLIRRTESERWGWKQPWTMLILEALLPEVQNPRFVVVRRNLSDVVDSLHRRDGITPEEALRVSTEIAARVEELVRRHPEIPTLTVRYEEVVRDPGAAARRLADFLGLSLSPVALGEVAGLAIPERELRQARRRKAGHDLWTLPIRYAWLLSQDLRVGSKFTASHLARTFPRELYQTLRAST
ncbi:MAG: sulfotransferase [Thermoplasmata archaeon]